MSIDWWIVCMFCTMYNCRTFDEQWNFWTNFYFWFSGGVGKESFMIFRKDAGIIFVFTWALYHFCSLDGYWLYTSKDLIYPADRDCLVMDNHLFILYTSRSHDLDHVTTNSEIPQVSHNYFISSFHIIIRQKCLWPNIQNESRKWK